MNKFFAKIYNDGFTWHDSIIFLAVQVFALEYIGGTLLYILVRFFLDENSKIMQLFTYDPYWSLLFMYLYSLGPWLAIVVYCLVTKRNRPILKAFTPMAKGNTILMFLFGILLGFGENSLGILAAKLHGDIDISFARFEFLPLLLMFVAVFIQSSSEELLCRGYMYQRLRKGYKSPWVAIIGNSVFFMALHLLNPGISAIPIIHLVVIALFFSVFVYYFDSIWIPMAFHTAWNFTQNIIFGLPNSGIVSSYSVWKLLGARGQITFFYDPTFGVEGSAFLLIVTILSLLAVILIGKKRGVKPIDVWADGHLLDMDIYTKYQ